MSAAVILAMPTTAPAPSGETGTVAPADDGAFAGMVAAETANADTTPAAVAETAPAEPVPTPTAPNQVHALISAAVAFALQPRPATGGAPAESADTVDGQDQALVAAIVIDGQVEAEAEPTTAAPDTSAEVQTADTDADQPATDAAPTQQLAITLPEPDARSAGLAATGSDTDLPNQTVIPPAQPSMDKAPNTASPAPADAEIVDTLTVEAPAKPAVTAGTAGPPSAESPTATAAETVVKALADLSHSAAQSLPTLAPQLVKPVARAEAAPMVASEAPIPAKTAVPVEAPLVKFTRAEAKPSEASSSVVPDGSPSVKSGPASDKPPSTDLTQPTAKATESPPEAIVAPIKAGETAPTAATTLAQPSSTPASTAVTAQASNLSYLSQATIETTAQIAAQISKTLAGRSTRFEMGLTPEGLGRVDVSLEIDAGGQLAARLSFDNPLAATEMRGRVEDLRRELQDAGFTIARDGLEFAERQSSSGNGFDRRQGRAFASASRITADADLASPAPPAWMSLSLTPRGVDLKV